MIIKDIQISGVGGIGDVNLSFDPRMNILCGPNGVGKTTILETIAHSFTQGETTILKRSSKHDSARVIASLQHGDKTEHIDYSFTEFEPSETAKVRGSRSSNYLMSLKTTRTFEYHPLEAIGRDVVKKDHQLWEEARKGVSLADLKQWFVHRYLYSAHPDTLSENQIANFEVAKNSFSLLDHTIKFLKVDPSTNEIMLSTPRGNIYYEYLSSGFKSCLSIIFAIIKEIEFRHGVEYASVKEYEGVVLIDELELHLHPEWQTLIASSLMSTFPKVQFITTTHSPHIIQAADINHIIALEFRDGEPFRRQLPSSSFGFSSWSIDEVLTDVMGMSDTRTQAFNRLMQSFENALDSLNADLAKVLYDQLMESLHPNNHLRKLLSMQMRMLIAKAND